MTNHMPQLTEALQRGSLGLFLGADLPAAVTGLPSRADLARALARRHGLAESDSLAAVAQQVGRHGQRFEIVAFLRDRLDTTGKSPQPFHRHVVDLVQRYQIATLVTTAYDDLLKRAFQDEHTGLNVVVRGGDVMFANPRTPTLYKLYGDLAQPDTLVVTEDDHYGLWRDREKEALLDEVRAALKKNAVLFLGYNLADPDFHLLWREVLDKAGKFAIGAYAAWPGATEAQKQVWEDRHVHAIDWQALDLVHTLVGQPQELNERQGATTGEVEPAGEPEPARGGIAPADARPDHLAAIRALLRAAFTPQDLRRFCEDRPLFRPIVDEFGPAHGLNDMVDEVVTYSSKHLLLNELLAAVKAVNPRQYTCFQEQLGSITTGSEIEKDWGAWRGWLTQRFDDPDLDAFCFDHFPEVYDRFSRGMRKDEKITLLLDHCRRLPEQYRRLVAAMGG
ncbi:MAG: SIR2 family protein [Anaerolineae bacterium]|nr:SIR2 family protein [Anaerolineae bacterium]